MSDVDPVLAFEVGKLISAARRAQGLSQAQLAARMGAFASSYVSAVECGRVGITVASLARFARALKVSMRDLLPHNEWPSASE